MSRKCSAPNLYDYDLTRNDDELNPNEKPVTLYTLKYVEFVIKSSVVVLVEYLHPNEGIEHQSLQLRLFTVALIRKERTATEIQDKRDDELENRLPDDHLPHRDRDQGCGLGLGLAIQDTGSRRISS
jgi:hypothetical protein